MKCLHTQLIVLLTALVSFVASTGFASLPEVPDKVLELRGGVFELWHQVQRGTLLKMLPEHHQDVQSSWLEFLNNDAKRIAISFYE